MSNEQIMVCAVCGRVLDRFEDDENGQVSFQHTLQDSGPDGEDHPAIPIPDREMNQEQKIGRCDFCNTDYPTWGIPARAFPMPDLPGHFSDGDWAACEFCKTLIVKNHWDTLTRRATENYRSNMPVPKEILRAKLAMMYNRLRKNINGEPYPLTEEKKES